MFTKVILYASTSQLGAGIWHRGKLHWHGKFMCDEAGRQQFDRFMQEHAKATMYLIVDAVEEDYRPETLPHVRGSTRRALLGRKLEQHYRTTPFRTACWIGRDQQRSDRYLFAALNVNEWLHGWLEIVRVRHARLQGVYLLPILSEALVRRLQFSVPHLLLSERLSSGLRQSYLQQGRLLFSRLVLLPPLAQSERDDFYATATEQTRQYLVSKQHLAPDARLSLLWLGMSDDPERLREETECDRDSGPSPDLSRLRRSLGLAPQLLPAHPELLHMALLARYPMPGNLAPATVTRNHDLGRLQRWLQSLAVVLLLGGLTVSLFNWRQYENLEARRLQVAQAMQRQQALYRQLPQTSAKASMAGTDLQRAVALHAVLDQYPRSPRRMMRILGAALATTPEIRIDRLRWVLGAEDLSQIERKGDASLPSTDSDAEEFREQAIISGAVTQFAGDYRTARSSLEHLVGQLRTHTGVAQVVMLEKPANPGIDTLLQGSTESGTPAELLPRATFELMLVLKQKMP